MIIHSKSILKNKQIWKIIVLFLFLFIFIENSYASDIQLTSEKEYYFNTGEEAVIVLKSNNDYGKEVSGMLTYTITQSINQAGFQYSSTNSQSQNFMIQNGENDVPFSFGTSNNPTSLAVDLSFSFNDNKEKKVDIRFNVYFVENKENQQQNQQESQTSKSQEVQQQSNQNQQNTKNQQQQSQSMQQILDQMFTKENQQKQDTSDKLQNNQLNQDSNALREQMKKQFEEEQKLKEEFKKSLEQNPNFQKEHNELVQQGYNVESGNLNPESKDTGEFELNYKTEDGRTASLKGNMQNNTIENIKKTSSEDDKRLLEQLSENKDFQEYNDKLSRDNFAETKSDITREENNTIITKEYKNDMNETAKITATFENDEIKDVNLVRNKKKNYLLLLLPLILIGVIFYILKKKKQRLVDTDNLPIIKEPFDYKSESKKLLEISKELYIKDMKKDAYTKAGEALRLFLRYEHNIEKELTNHEVLEEIIKNKNFLKVKKCFNLCSLVSFAKYKPNDKDFGMITKIAYGIIDD